MPEEMKGSREAGSRVEKADPRSEDGASEFAESVRIMARLRGPDGCPWDREQDFASIRKHTIEETYEVLDAIDKRDWSNLQEELGDLLLQVLFYAQMASEAGHFTIADVAAGLNAKLIRRHPHIFGDVEAKSSDAVLRNWELIKAEEKRERAAEAGAGGYLEDVSRSVPGLMEAQKLGSKAAKAGFDWPDASAVLVKLEEEIAELRAEMDAGSAGNLKRVEEESGDVLFTLANLCRKSNVDAEMALRGSSARFRRRFQWMEDRVATEKVEWSALDSEQLEGLWQAAKRAEAQQV